MKIPVPSSFRARVFLVLTVVSLLPTVLTVGAGVLVMREFVQTTGSAGAWDQVAESGRALFDELEREGALEPGTVEAASRHETALGASVRFSRLYAFLGDRVLTLLPLFALVVFLLVAALALVAANWFSRDFSRPVEELVRRTRALAAGAVLPHPSEEPESRGGIREFAQLRHALHATSLELEEARRKELERERMRSWADMARKVAHELKNPLTPMRMAADRVARAGEPAVASAGEVLREEIEHLDAMARSLSQFGKPPEGPMSEVDLTELVNALAGRLGSDPTPVVVRGPERAVNVTGHLQAIERVVRNLIANAQEAADGGGGRGGEVGRDGERAPVEISLAALENGAEIRVSDRGPGLSPEVLARLWEPDFTTKARGTGLGLPMVKQVVESHGGSVSAHNRDGGGAEFRIHLPYAPPPADA